MSTCYLVGAGDFADFSKAQGDLVVAADGGYLSVLSSFTPDVLVGDFDSLSGPLPEGIETYRHPVRKDETDMMLAYQIGVQKGYTDFVIIGGTGGRPDHTFANYSLLLHIVEQGMKAKMIDEKYEYTVIKNSKIELDFTGFPVSTVSIFAFGGDAVGVGISGLEYEVTDATLRASFALGVSNGSVGRRAEISVREGALLIMCERSLRPT